jgi:hypothetical protein
MRRSAVLVDENGKARVVVGPGKGAYFLRPTAAHVGNLQRTHATRL